MAPFKEILLMEKHVCPSWLYFSLDTVFRKPVHNPEKIFTPYISKEQTAIDIGCGPGYFSYGLADIVGPLGKVIAVDIQENALEKIAQRIKGTEREKIIHTVHATPEYLMIQEKADFVLNFWMLHEVGNTVNFIKQVVALMKPGSY